MVDVPTSLPKTSMLTMCLGKSISASQSAETGTGMQEEGNGHLVESPSSFNLRCKQLNIDIYIEGDDNCVYLFE